MKRLVGYKELRTIIPVARITFDRWMTREIDPFPQSVTVGCRKLWWLDEVYEWLDRQPRGPSH